MTFATVFIGATIGTVFGYFVIALITYAWQEYKRKGGK